MGALFDKFVFWRLGKLYRKHGGYILYVKGTEKDFPKYVLYTEDEAVRNELIKTWRRL